MDNNRISDEAIIKELRLRRSEIEKEFVSALEGIDKSIELFLKRSGKSTMNGNTNKSVFISHNSLDTINVQNLTWKEKTKYGLELIGGSGTVGDIVEALMLHLTEDKETLIKRIRVAASDLNGDGEINAKPSGQGKAFTYIIKKKKEQPALFAESSS